MCYYKSKTEQKVIKLLNKNDNKELVDIVNQIEEKRGEPLQDDGETLGGEEIEWEQIYIEKRVRRERERETKLLQYAAKSMNKVFFR